MNFAANLTMLFTEYDFLDRFEKAYKNNFKAVEYLFPYDYKPQELKNLLNEFNLKQVLHNLPAGDWINGERGIACHPDRIDEFKIGVDTAIEYAKTLNCNQLNCLIGIPPEGISEEELENVIINNLKYASDKLKNEEIISKSGNGHYEAIQKAKKNLMARATNFFFGKKDKSIKS